MRKRKMTCMIAIALMSSMAVASVPAILTIVSAVEDPALQDDGKLEDDASFDSLFPSGSTTMKLVVPESDEVSTFQLKTDLNEVSKAANLSYIDSLGREIHVEVDKVSWKVTDGSAYLSVKDDGRVTAKHDAGKKAGKATIQLKIAAKVDLGGGRGTKRLNYTKNFTAYVYEQGKTYLEAFHGSSQITDGDLTSLAAYGDTVTFKLVKPKIKDSGAFGWFYCC